MSLSDSPVGVAKRCDALLVSQHAAGPRPIRTPHAVVDAEGVDDPQHRVPDVVVREGFAGERAGAADLDPDVRVGRERQQLWQIGPWLRQWRRLVGLQQTEMVDDNDGVGVSPHHLRACGAAIRMRRARQSG